MPILASSPPDTPRTWSSSSSIGRRLDRLLNETSEDGFPYNVGAAGYPNYDGMSASAGPMMDIDRLLRRLLQENDGYASPAPFASPPHRAAETPDNGASAAALLSGPLYEYGRGAVPSTPQVLRPEVPPVASPPSLEPLCGASTLDWLLQLSRRTGTVTDHTLSPTGRSRGPPHRILSAGRERPSLAQCLFQPPSLAASVVPEDHPMPPANFEDFCPMPPANYDEYPPLPPTSTVSQSLPEARRHWEVYLSDISSELGPISSVDPLRALRIDDISCTSVSDEDYVHAVEPSEEVVSVFDVTDEPASSRDARGVVTDELVRGQQEAYSQGVQYDLDGEGSGSSVPLSSASSHYTAVSSQQPRSAGLIARDDVQTLQGTLGNMLRRLTDENTLEESAMASVRRVLQMGAVLTGHRLSDEEIRDLPKVRFEAEEQQSCSICLEAYKEGDLLTALPCNHFFHVECVNGWMQRATRCPLCRHECGLRAAAAAAPQAAGPEEFE